MLRLRKPLPHGQFEVILRFGDPFNDDDAGVPNLDFLKTELISLPSPFPLRLSWQPTTVIHSVYGHRLVVPEVIDALRELVTRHGYEDLRCQDWDLFGGMWSFRQKRNGNEWSTHAWGIAVDYCPDLGPMGQPDADYPEAISEVFLKRGFVQLSNDKSHFQACEGM